MKTYLTDMDKAWTPAESEIPTLLPDLMYMGNYKNIHLYKHRITRHYINIGDDGYFWQYVNGTYFNITKESAVNNLLQN